MRFLLTKRNLLDVGMSEGKTEKNWSCLKCLSKNVQGKILVVVLPPPHFGVRI